MEKNGTITIDGPAASGKTTIGHRLATELNFLFLDTGCMYRAVTWAALDQKVDLNDEQKITDLAHSIIIQIETAVGDPDRLYTVHVDGIEVTDLLRTPEVDANVSLVSSYIGVRSAMVEQQRAIASERPVVMVGRDIGTVVLPNAPLKLYMVATAEERARRRLKDRQDDGNDASFEEILKDIQRRDDIDGNRTNSPMRPADDAILVDTSNKEPQVVLDQILEYVTVLQVV